MKTYFLSQHWKYIPNKRLLIINNNKIQLRSHVATVFHMLCLNLTRVLPTNEIIDAIWKEDYFNGLKGLRTSIWEIRKHFKTNNIDNPIQNTRNQGYQINTQVKEIKSDNWFVFLKRILKRNVLFLSVIGLNMAVILIAYLSIISKINQLQISHSSIDQKASIFSACLLKNTYSPQNNLTADMSFLQ